jgi:hypothetical protein
MAVRRNRLHVVRATIMAAIAIAVSCWTALAQTTAAYVDSQVGDFIGNGQQQTFSEENASLTLLGASRQVTMHIYNGGVYSWSLTFSAPEGATLAVGAYHGATRPAFARFNGLEVSGNGRGCDSLTGWFQVLEIAFDSSGQIVRFAADFEQHCNNQTAALFGAVRYNSSITSLTLFEGRYPSYSVTVTPSAHGTVTGDAIECGPVSAQCSTTFPEAAALALRAVPDPGYELLSWGAKAAT